MDPVPWQALGDGQQEFAWQHLGRSAGLVGDVLGTLSALPMTAPRTGHLADWSDIYAGRSSVLDYNLIICGKDRLGSPLLYDFNQTENLGLSSGDTLFLPGSLVTGGVRRGLPLRCWEAGRMRPHDRSTSLFVPYVETDNDGETLPLASLLRRFAAGPSGEAGFHSDFLLRERERASELLTVLVKAAGADERALTQIFDRVVHRDGRVERAPLRRSGHRYLLDGCTYPSAEDMVEASFLPARVAQAESRLGDVLAEVPETVPLLSVDLVVLLYAVLGSHRGPGQPALCGSFDAHFQWGALAMAGYPPHRAGYFSRRVKKCRALYETAVRELSWTAPLLLVMVPAAPFLLWPSSREPRDTELIGDLVSRALKVTARQPGPADGAARTDETAMRWWADKGSQLSPAFRQQLNWTSRLSPSGDQLPPGEPRKPANFDHLTMSQACRVVGTLIKAAAE
jgi:hypothetical protein